MPAVMFSSRKIDRPTNEGSNGRRASGRDVSNKSHTIKEIVVVKTPQEAMKDPTPRRRGDGGGNEFGFDVNKRRTMDPPGYNETAGGVSISKGRSREPESVSSVHRRRKRFIEQHARRIMGGRESSSSKPGGKGARVDLDGTDSTASISQHSSWVPTRTVDKDPYNRPPRQTEAEARLAKQTMEVRDRAVPQRSWQPERRHTGKKKRYNLADDDEMDFSPSNEWVPSEFYRKQQSSGMGQGRQASGPRIISPYPPNEQPQYEYQQKVNLLYPRNEQPQFERYPQNEQAQYEYQQYSQPMNRHYPPNEQPQYEYQQYSQSVSRHYPPNEQPHYEYQQYSQAMNRQSLPPPPELRKQEKPTWRPHQLPQQPPSVIHTVTTATTPSTPTPEVEMELKRKSMASEMDLSDVVISSNESSTKVKNKYRDSEGSSSILEAFKNKYVSKRWSDESKDLKEAEENSTIQDSLKKDQNSKKRNSEESKDAKESEESSTILDSYKAMRKGTRQSEESLSPRDSSLEKIINKDYYFDMNNEDTDESLLSSSLTNLETPSGVPTWIIPQKVIPSIIRKSAASDITFDMNMDATRQGIDSTLTYDEDNTFSSTIHNSIISQEDTAAAAALAASLESGTSGQIGNSNLFGSGAIGVNESLLGSGAGGLIGKSITARKIIDSDTSGVTQSLIGSNTTGPMAKNLSARRLIESGTNGSLVASYPSGLTGMGATMSGVSGSLIGSNTSGLTGRIIPVRGLSESGVSGLTSSGQRKDAAGSLVTAKLAGLTDEIRAGARRKMEDIPSEVSSYIEDTLSNKRQDSEADDQADDRSSWHHRSNITITSTMVSTKKIGNKAKRGPRRSSTSTLPSIGSIIPEEMWVNYDDDEEESDEDDEIFEVPSDSDESEDEEIALEKGGQLSSILEVASRDMSRGAASRDMTSASRDISRVTSNVESAKSSSNLRSRSLESSSRIENPTKPYCDCLDIRCFERKEDGTRGKFNPTLGAYVVMFLTVFMVALWTGIGIVWYRFQNRG